VRGSEGKVRNKVNGDDSSVKVIGRGGGSWTGGNGVAGGFLTYQEGEWRAWRTISKKTIHYRGELEHQTFFRGGSEANEGERTRKHRQEKIRLKNRPALGR